MKVSFSVILLFGGLALAQNPDEDNAARELRRLLALPLQQYIQEIAPHRGLAGSAYHRQRALEGRDCSAEAKQGQ